MPLEKEEFKTALSRWASGLTIITACDSEGEPKGFTASSFASLSLDPPMVLYCLARASARFEIFAQSKSFGVNMLTWEQAEYSNHFSRRDGPGFSEVPYTLGKLGVPLLNGCMATLECKVHSTLPGGDHIIVTGVVEEANWNEESPLIYFRSKYHTL